MIDRYALITGASSGIGAEFARQLAAQGVHLALVGRSEARLTPVAEEIRAAYPVAVETLAADLGGAQGVERVITFIEALPHLDYLVNNAGYGTTGYFAESDIGRQVGMLDLHVTAALRLCRAALPGMIARGSGAIVNVASVSAFAPMPHTAVYSATKAALVNFSRGLQTELRGTGVRVQALCPGFTRTRFHSSAEFEGFRTEKLPGLLWTQADAVVRDSLRALRNGGPLVVVPGWFYRLGLPFLQTRPVRMLLEAFGRS